MKPVMRSNQVLSHKDANGKHVFCFGECQCKNKLAAGTNEGDYEEKQDYLGEDENDEEFAEDIVWYVSNAINIAIPCCFV
ncbi:hypothetical protein P3T76_008462 [Phytophthora citrophthora]|uniref:Uncharacterized protein n=1 Tax=Phytophthora citrophthora TaxID=4793 RepID=A0AAD9GK07_9STRA|nr:hypothetical protein P3T76_008462 [Phytophthora citrophthora]